MAEAPVWFEGKRSENSMVQLDSVGDILVQETGLSGHQTKPQKDGLWIPAFVGMTLLC